MSKQNQYKLNIPELRFPEFSGEWEEKKLGDVTNFYSGLTYSPNDLRDKGTFVIRSSNIKNNKLVKADDVFVRREIVNKEKVNVGDVVVVVRNGSRSLIGKHARVNKKINDAVIGAFMTGLRYEYSKFLSALLDTQSFRREIHKNLGATINQITTGIFKSMSFNFPKESEQKKIGDFFSKLDRQIELEEKKLALLEEQKKGYMQKIFSQELRFKDENGNEYPEWEKVNLEDVLKMKEGVRRGPFGGSLKKEIFIKEGYAVYEQANAIYDNQKFRYFIDENKFNEMKNFSVKADDIIMSCSGTIGKLSLIPKNYKEGIINQALIRFRVSEKLNPQYFLYFMKSGMMQRKILNSNPGSAIVNLIPVKELKKLSLKVPSIGEQEKISYFLNNLDSLLAKKQCRIKMIKNRKESFLQKMFL